MRVKCFPPIINDDCEVLILGTSPGAKSLSRNEYYAHEGNRFWSLMYVLFAGSSNLNYEGRKELLLSKRIALWDVLAECDRVGSGDNAIRNEQPNDFNSLLRRYPRVNRIVFNGLNPKRYFDAHVKLEKPVALAAARSTSPANNRNYSFDQLVEIWRPLIEVS